MREHQRDSLVRGGAACPQDASSGSKNQTTRWGQRVPPSSAWVAQAGRLPSHFLRSLIWLYQKTLSPALVVLAPTCGCRFAPTCSHYASEALREHGVITGLSLTVRRLARCGPWHPGGLDPVPPRRCTRVALKSISLT